jgi:hypothetical protein
MCADTRQLDLFESDSVGDRPRSRLYSLAPCITGGGRTESMTGYLARLADAHCVPISALVSRIVAPRLRQGRIASRNRLSGVFGTVGLSFNGNSPMAGEVVEVINELTGRTDLDSLTMLFTAGHISHKGLLRPSQAWCPACFSEWKESGVSIHMPLLWSLATVSACTRHARSLSTLCPSCQRPHYPLDWGLRPGFCPKCKCWLGHAGDSAGGTGSLAEWDAYSAFQSEDFLNRAPALLPRSGRSCFAANLRLAVASSCDDSISMFAKLIGYSRRSVRDWINGNQLPHLASLLVVASALGVDAASLCCCQLDDFELVGDPHKLLPESVLEYNRAHGRRYDSGKLRLKLEQLLRRDTHGSVSLARAANILGCDQTHLSRRFPDLAARIKKAHQSRITDRANNRAARIRCIIRRVMEDLYGKGEFPSLWRMKRDVPRGISMRDPIALGEWRSALLELTNNSA